MKLPMTLNDPPYGAERCFNALPLAHGYYTMERMAKRVPAGNGRPPRLRSTRRWGSEP